MVDRASVSCCMCASCFTLLSAAYLRNNVHAYDCIGPGRSGPRCMMVLAGLMPAMRTASPDGWWRQDTLQH